MKNNFAKTIKERAIKFIELIVSGDIDEAYTEIIVGKNIAADFFNCHMLFNQFFETYRYRYLNLAVHKIFFRLSKQPDRHYYLFNNQDVKVNPRKLPMYTLHYSGLLHSAIETKLFLCFNILLGMELILRLVVGLMGLHYIMIPPNLHIITHK